MRSSYSEEDVILLLKDITGLVEPQPAKVREKLIQSGKHYSEMLPVEYVPTDQYMQVYHNALKHYAKPVANAVGMLADKIIENKGKKMVLVSLARAGIPIGILVKRYIKFKYGINVPHYSISIHSGSHPCQSIRPQIKSAAVCTFQADTSWHYRQSLFL